MTSPAAIGVGADALPESCDLLVVGLGVTGAGVALDAATRGLSVVAVDAHDLAFGTSRWSSKLVHGGLRYLAHGQVGVAHESAVERGVLMQTTAPHLTRTLRMVVPLTPATDHLSAALTRAGTAAGDLLRAGARTSAQVLPRSRRISAAEALALAPGIRRQGLRGAVLSFDGQLEDDARLVVAIARTAAAHGAHVRTRVRATSVSGNGAMLLDERTFSSLTLRAKAVVNATGVWAGTLAPSARLRPSRGTHLVLGPASLPDLRAAVMAPVPGSRNRFVFVLPQPDGTRYVGLTDVPADGPVPDVPEPTPQEVDFLLDTVARVLEQPIKHADVLSAYAGLRPLLDSNGSTADLSRRHAVLVDDGVVTVVGGKLTTYRRMAQDAVDATGLACGPCRTRTLPLLGAAPRENLDPADRLQRRYGTEADLVLTSAAQTTGWSSAELASPLAPGVPTLLAELVFGVTHEGATTAADLLERRTRLSLVPAHAELARPVAERVLARISP
ncbi:glycerol-3-phosphate dehydrogenase/oxidase [Nocardioides mangrovicus]|uniref:Glycerol-3-phosphate dehydrogenase/oxidase n=1 Tax=Nocardioides mangrovicus TaxID=2478913 RepID=A0A3L8NZE1_9ACTN|nr:glycerol-3-phosphate dehydrogenase/oxidase [Nocardioides mangrovicus]RLV48151.1 glycerol-3-phosphate dehydrogenase/oxidase [Nocardioides mangrovicus]